MSKDTFHIDITPGAQHGLPIIIQPHGPYSEQALDRVLGAIAQEAWKRLMADSFGRLYVFFQPSSAGRWGTFYILGTDTPAPKGSEAVTAQAVPSNRDANGIRTWLRPMAGRLPILPQEGSERKPSGRETVDWKRAERLLTELHSKRILHVRTQDGTPFTIECTRPSEFPVGYGIRKQGAKRAGPKRIMSRQEALTWLARLEPDAGPEQAVPKARPSAAPIRTASVPHRSPKERFKAGYDFASLLIKQGYTAQALSTISNQMRETDKSQNFAMGMHKRMMEQWNELRKQPGWYAPPGRKHKVTDWRDVAGTTARRASGKRTSRPKRAVPKPTRRSPSPKRPSPTAQGEVTLNILEPRALLVLATLEGSSWASKQRAQGLKLDNGFFLNKRAFKEMVYRALVDVEGLTLADLDPSAGVILGEHGTAYIVMPDGEIMLDGASASSSKRKAAARRMAVI